MRVLVTGGCGYIASALLPRLLEREGVSEVVVLDSLDGATPRTLLGMAQDVTFVRGDVRDEGDVARATDGVDTVVHLAAITGASGTRDRPGETFAVNRDGTETVVTAAGAAGVDTVVFASSCSVYGDTGGERVDETGRPDPRTPYGESKLAAERVVREAADRFDFDATSLRVSTAYGYAPAVRFNLVVNRFVFRGLTDRPLPVHGDGRNWRPFVHARDAASAFEHALVRPERWPEDVYNVGSAGGNYRIEDVAAIVSDAVDASDGVEVARVDERASGPSYRVNFDRVADTGLDFEWTLGDGACDLARRLSGDSETPPRSNRRDADGRLPSASTTQ